MQLLLVCFFAVAASCQYVHVEHPFEKGITGLHSEKAIEDLLCKMYRENGSNVKETEIKFKDVYARSFRYFDKKDAANFLNVKCDEEEIFATPESIENLFDGIEQESPITSWEEFEIINNPVKFNISLLEEINKAVKKIENHVEDGSLLLFVGRSPSYLMKALEYYFQAKKKEVTYGIVHLFSSDYVDVNFYPKSPYKKTFLESLSLNASYSLKNAVTKIRFDHYLKHMESQGFKWESKRKIYVVDYTLGGASMFYFMRFLRQTYRFKRVDMNPKRFSALLMSDIKDQKKERELSERFFQQLAEMNGFSKPDQLDTPKISDRYSTKPKDQSSTRKKEFSDEIKPQIQQDSEVDLNCATFFDPISPDFTGDRIEYCSLGMQNISFLIDNPYDQCQVGMHYPAYKWTPKFDVERDLPLHECARNLLAQLHEFITERNK